MPSIVRKPRIQNWPDYFAGFVSAGVVAAAAMAFWPLACHGQSGLVDAGEFASVSRDQADASAGARDTTKGSFFGGMPLSGNVSVIDRVREGGMRLKRAKLQADATDTTAGGGDDVANSHKLPLGGLVEEGATKFQSLFPSLDNSQTMPNLSGGARHDKAAPIVAPKPHPIWQKSPLGGYYDASGNYRQVVKGADLYRYGGTMADGMTPAPTGPVEQNSMGYIKWQPIHGGPPGWY